MEGLDETRTLRISPILKLCCEKTQGDVRRAQSADFTSGNT